MNAAVRDFTGEILVVDDTMANLKWMTEILKGAGYRTRATNDGELALRSVRARPPALILLDITMPGLDGFEVCRRLKAEEITRDIPVIFLSSLAEMTDKTLGFELGAVDYITKPAHAQEVLARVDVHLALATAREQLKIQNLQLHRINQQLRKAQVQLEEAIAARTAELRRANEKYRALFLEARDGVVLMDAETGQIVDCNPEFERQSGRSLAELQTQRIWELRPAECVDSAKNLFFQVREMGRGGSSELDLQQPDGTRIPVEFSARALILDDQLYVQSISRDLTERRQRADDRAADQECRVQ